MHLDNSGNSQSLAMMSAMAQPKFIEVRREQLLRASRRTPIGALLMFGFAAGFTIIAQQTGGLTGFLPVTFIGSTLGLILFFLGRLIPHKLEENSLYLARNVRTISRFYALLCVAIAGTFGILAAASLKNLPSLWHLYLGVCSFGIASLLAFTCGLWQTPLYILFTIPPLWFGTAYTIGAIPSMPTAVIGLLLGTFVYPLAAFWSITFTRYLKQGLQQYRLIDYLENARLAAEQASNQLEAEITQRNIVEHQLRDIKSGLEKKIATRTSELTEANKALNRQIRLKKSMGEALMKSQTRLTQAIEATNLALWDLNLADNNLYQSYFHPSFGPKEMPARRFFRQMKRKIHPEDLLKVRRRLRSCLQGTSDLYRLRYRIQDNDNRWVWVEDCGKVVSRDVAGKVVRLLGTRRDITEDRLRDDQVRLTKSVFDNTSDGVFALDQDLKFLTINRAFERITGYNKTEIIGRKLDEFSQVPNKQKVFSRVREELLMKGSWHGELYEKRQNGDYFLEYLQLKAITNNEGKITHYTGLFSDLTERKEKDEKLHYLLNYDELTGLPNRVLFRERFHQALDHTRESQRKLALIVIDLDRFRSINESLGHDGGDQILSQVASRITRHAPYFDSTARMGTDEFAILMWVKSRIDIAKFCEKLLLDLKAPYQIEGRDLFVSTSIGITQAPDHGREIQALIQQANTAVKQAKYLGGNTYEFYSLMLRDISGKRIEMESDLRKAVQDDELEVYFQPKFSLASQQITGAEALVRWRHPSRGMIAPAEFVAVAEESGLITALGRQVLHQACHQAVTWQKLGLGHFDVAVNVSAFQMRQQNLPAVVQATLDETGLAPNHLDLELTESALMEDLNHTKTVLYKLRDMGIKITIDDFGTGYSSLAYLKRFPINALKVDRMFISDVHSNADDAAITRAIILLAKSLNLEVIAEGVEQPEHLEFLMANGCHTAQGFLIGRPLATGDMIARLQEQLEYPFGLPSMLNR